MHCPKCNHSETRVIDSRVDKNGASIRRRRECQQCAHRFNTLEEAVREGLFVIKRDGTREPFERGKILAGLRHATYKRPIDVEQIEMLVADCLSDLEREFSGPLPTRAIGEKLMEKLREIDQVAFVRFASVYRNFQDVSEFEQTVTELKQ